MIGTLDLPKCPRTAHILLWKIENLTTVIATLAFAGVILTSCFYMKHDGGYDLAALSLACQPGGVLARQLGADVHYWPAGLLASRRLPPTCLLDCLIIRWLPLSAACSC